MARPVSVNIDISMGWVAAFKDAVEKTEEGKWQQMLLAMNELGKAVIKELRKTTLGWADSWYPVNKSLNNFNFDNYMTARPLPHRYEAPEGHGVKNAAIPKFLYQTHKSGPKSVAVRVWTNNINWNRINYGTTRTGSIVPRRAWVGGWTKKPQGFLNLYSYSPSTRPGQLLSRPSVRGTRPYTTVMRVGPNNHIRIRNFYGQIKRKFRENGTIRKIVLQTMRLPIRGYTGQTMRLGLARYDAMARGSD